MPSAIRVIDQLAELADVTLAGLVDGDVLEYDTGTSSWINVPAGSTGFWDRIGNILTPSTAGDNITTTGIVTTVRLQSDSLRSNDGISSLSYYILGTWYAGVSYDGNGYNSTNWDTLDAELGIFETVQLTNLLADSAVYTDGSKFLTTTAPTTGTIGYWQRFGTTVSTATAGDDISTTGMVSASNGIGVGGDQFLYETSGSLQFVSDNDTFIFGDDGVNESQLTVSNIAPHLTLYSWGTVDGGSGSTRFDPYIGVGGDPVGSGAGASVTIEDGETVELILNDTGQNTYYLQASDDYFKIIQGGTDYLKIVAGDFDFQSGDLTTTGKGHFSGGLVDIGGIFSVDSDGRNLYDASGTIKSIDWDNRYLYADNGTDIVLDYSTAGTAQFNDSDIVTTGTLTVSSITMAYRTISSTDTLTTADHTINCTENTFTVNLPTAASITGRTYSIKNSGTGTITVDAYGTETIDGDTTKELIEYDNMVILSDGTNWIII